MNLFLLSWKPAECARWHVDKHVVKMVLEATQLLYSAHHLNQHSDSWQKQTPVQPYRLSHASHPTAKWVRRCEGNYRLTAQIGHELCKEYTFRYNRTHACQPHIEWLMVNLPPFAEPEEQADAGVPAGAPPAASATLAVNDATAASTPTAPVVSDSVATGRMTRARARQLAEQQPVQQPSAGSPGAADSKKHKLDAPEEQPTKRPRTKKAKQPKVTAFGVEGLPAGVTPVPLAMPEEYYHTDPVEAYRAYYLGAKAGFAKWKVRSPPPWWTRVASE